MKRLFNSNGGLVALIALLLAIISLVLSFIFTGANPVANLWGVVTTPFRSAGAAVASWTGQTFDRRNRVDYLQQEVERLRTELAQAQQDAREGEAAKAENENLRSILGLKQKRRELELDNATVTARSQSNWSSTLTISKGSQHGVERHQCIVDPYGNLVGVVDEVGWNWATVLTVVDTDTDMGGKISRRGAESAAVLEGDFELMTQGRLKLSYLSQDTQLMAGDLVLTSGRGGVYPPDLVVGTVEFVQTDPSGMTRFAVVSPAADLDALSQVFIIKSFDIVE